MQASSLCRCTPRAMNVFLHIERCLCFVCCCCCRANRCAFVRAIRNGFAFCHHTTFVFDICLLAALRCNATKCSRCLCVCMCIYLLDCAQLASTCKSPHTIWQFFFQFAFLFYFIWFYFVLFICIIIIVVVAVEVKCLMHKWKLMVSICIPGLQSENLKSCCRSSSVGRTSNVARLSVGRLVFSKHWHSTLRINAFD